MEQQQLAQGLHLCQETTGQPLYSLATTLGPQTHLATPGFAFYSIGESLDLALLDARVTALVTAIGAAL
jgi:hypothetical protein